MKYLAGFIGAGNMGGALASAASKAVSSGNISVSDNDTQKANALAESIGAISTSNADIVKNAKYIFLGVKPQVLPSLFTEIAPILKNRSDEFILVTMAAGISIADIAGFSGSEYPTIRIMPNTPVSVGKGVILYTANDNVKDTAEFLDILKYAGNLEEIPEKLIDAASCITGCGPAWIYMFIEALADGGVECGLPRKQAIEYACNTLIGSASLVLESGKHPGLLKDEVTSPGGTTIAGVHALEKKSFRGTVMDAVKAAYEKTINIKK